MSAQGPDSVERCLAELLSDLRRLERRVDGLATRIDAIETSEPSTGPSEATPVVAEEESLWSWVGQSRVLPRIASVCFVLVVALVLRTLTDGGMIALQLGVVLGMVYAAGLVAWGWRGLARGSRGKNVLPACGTALMCSVVLEGHGPFQLLSAAQANGILFSTLAALTVLGLAYRAGAVVAFGVLLPAVSALVLGFPNPQFPSTAAVLFAANLAGLLASPRHRMGWLPFSTLALALFFWLLWGFKTNAALDRPEAVMTALFPEWFLPCLIAFAALFAVVAAVRALARPNSPGVFHVLAPAVNVLWVYATAFAVVVPTGHARELGLTGVVVAILHYGVAAFVWRRIRECAHGITAFSVAGTLLLTLAVPSAVGDLLFAVPVWAAVALGIGVSATVCGSPSLRLLSFALQGLACAFAAAGSAYALPSSSPVLALGGALVLTALSAAHFRLMRTHPPPVETFIARLDPTDRNVIGLLWCTAINAFLFLCLLAYAGIEAVGIDVDNAFRGTQSVIINGASIVLMLWGLRRKNKEILGTAVVVAVVGGIKVFVADLQTTNGIPLVLAVLSFGLAAAVGSVVLGKWQAATVPVDSGSEDSDVP